MNVQWDDRFDTRPASSDGWTPLRVWLVTLTVAAIIVSIALVVGAA